MIHHVANTGRLGARLLTIEVKQTRLSVDCAIPLLFACLYLTIYFAARSNSTPAAVKPSIFGNQPPNQGESTPAKASASQAIISE